MLGEPPYSVYTAGHATRLGEVATAEDAISLVVAHLPTDLGARRDRISAADVARS